MFGRSCLWTGWKQTVGPAARSVLREEETVVIQTLQGFMFSPFHFSNFLTSQNQEKDSFNNWAGVGRGNLWSPLLSIFMKYDPKLSRCG